MEEENYGKKESKKESKKNKENQEIKKVKEIKEKIKCLSQLKTAFKFI